MKLRQAIKICNEVYRFETKDMDNRVAKKRSYKQIQEAKRVCNRGKRWLNDQRIPYIPSEQEEHEQMEMFGCIMFGLAEAIGVSREEIEKKQEEFYLEMDKCRPK